MSERMCATSAMSAPISSISFILITAIVSVRMIKFFMKPISMDCSTSYLMNSQKASAVAAQKRQSKKTRPQPRQRRRNVLTV